MLVEAIDRSMQTWVYPEWNRKAFDSDYRIISFERVQSLMEAGTARAIVFKPLCDTHLTDRFLDRFSEWDPVAIWIYRNYCDVAASAVREWGDHFARVVEKIAEGDVDDVGWRGERLTPEMLEKVQSWVKGGISAVEGGAIFWYLRNRFLFDLGLERDRRVIVINYERLVRHPAQNLARVFDLIGLEFNLRFVSHIHTEAINRRSARDIAPEIRKACGALQEQLDCLDVFGA